VADKLIVIGGLAVLADRGVFPWWPVLLIAAREFGISLYRSIAGRRGIVAPRATPRQVQGVHSIRRRGFRVAADHRDYLGFQQVVLAVAVTLTIVSGLQIVSRGYIDCNARTPERAPRCRGLDT